MTFRLGIGIGASRSTVFEFVADATTMPRWYTAVTQVDCLVGTRGLGTRYAVYRDLPGGAALNEVEITTYERGQEVTFTSLSGPSPFVYRYLVEPDRVGTQLTLEGARSAEPGSRAWRPSSGRWPRGCSDAGCETTSACSRGSWNPRTRRRRHRRRPGPRLGASRGSVPPTLG